VGCHKLFRCIPEKYKQIVRSIESLLDLSTMSIEEVIRRLKVIDGDEPQPLSGPITVGGKLHLTREQWEACQGDGKKGSPLPWRAAASAASGTSRAEASKPGHKDVPRVAPAEAPPTVPPESRSRHKTASGTTVESLAIGPRSVYSHDAVRPTSHRWRRRSQLCSWHMQVSSLSPAASAATALLHLDEPRAHTLLSDGSSSDKTDGWCLDTSATHHMTGRWEFFTELDSDVRDSVKFGVASGVEIKDVGSVIFAAKSGEHRCNIPATPGLAIVTSDSYLGS
jgi:hypothetical protein